MLIEKLTHFSYPDFKIVIAASIIAWVYMCVLIQPGEILAGWARWLGMRVKEGTLLNRFLLECEKCLAGQLALIISLCNGIISPFQILINICSSIILVIFFSKLLIKDNA